VTFAHQKGDKYLITGYYYNTGIKFRLVRFNPYAALSINLWRGKVWHVRGKKRTLVKEVYN
jgi:hypothetical protein